MNIYSIVTKLLQTIAIPFPILHETQHITKVLQYLKHRYEILQNCYEQNTFATICNIFATSIEQY